MVHRCAAFETRCCVGNLEDGVAYRFRVSAANAHKQSEPSMESHEFTCLDSGAPSAPAGPLRCSVSEDQVTVGLEWQAPKTTGGSHIKRYIVERKLLGTHDWTKVCALFQFYLWYLQTFLGGLVWLVLLAILQLFLFKICYVLLRLIYYFSYYK